MIPTDQLARVVWLTASAVSTALRSRGCTDDRLYAAAVTPLSAWAGLSRGNLLHLMGILVGCIRESDTRRGPKNALGVLRFGVGRRALTGSLDWSHLVPAGKQRGGAPPIKIVP